MSVGRFKDGIYPVFFELGNGKRRAILQCEDIQKYKDNLEDGINMLTNDGGYILCERISEHKSDEFPCKETAILQNFDEKEETDEERRERYKRDRHLELLRNYHTISIELEFINDMIYQSYLHGSDGHGGWNANEEELIKSMEHFLKWKGYEEIAYVVSVPDNLKEGLAFALMPYEKLEKFVENEKEVKKE